MIVECNVQHKHSLSLNATIGTQLSGIFWNRLFKNSISDNTFDKKYIMLSALTMALISADKVLWTTQRRVFIFHDNGNTLLFCPTRKITCPSALFVEDKFARDVSL